MHIQVWEFLEESIKGLINPRFIVSYHYTLAEGILSALGCFVYALEMQFIFLSLLLSNNLLSLFNCVYQYFKSVKKTKKE